MTEHFDTADGLRLAYRDEGAGPPVLCLAGLTRNGEDFDAFAARFRDRFRVIRLDARGRGASDPAPDPASYAVPVEAADALALLDRLGLARAALVGTSRGGLVGMTIAATQPARLTAVALNDVGPEIAPDGLATIMSYVGLPPQAKTLDEAARGFAKVLGPRFPTVDHAGWLAHARRIYRETGDGLALRYDPRIRDALIAQAEALGDQKLDLWPLFDALAPIPTLLIRGANSDLLTAETAAKMRERKPDMAYAEVPDRGHAPFLDEPEAVAALDAFLSAHAQ